MFIGFSIVCVAALSFITYKQYVFPYDMDMYSNLSLFCVVISIFIFLCVKKIKVKKCGFVISFVAQSAIAVYLFQECEVLKAFLWETFNLRDVLGSYKVYLYMVVSMLVIWAISILMHQIFTLIYKKLVLKQVKKLSLIDNVMNE